MTEHERKAREYFRSGYNCSQAVLLAFSDVTKLENNVAARLSSSFGGGIARMREVCGAASGAFMVLGIVLGPADTSDHEAKKKHYSIVQEAAALFKERNSSIICRELLGLPSGASSAEPEKRTDEYYKRRPCEEYVAVAANITDEILSKYTKK